MKSPGAEILRRGIEDEFEAVGTENVHGEIASASRLEGRSVMPGGRYVSTHISMDGYTGVLVEAMRSPEAAASDEPVAVSVMAAEEKTTWVAEGNDISLRAGESARGEFSISRRLVRIEVEMPVGLPPTALALRLTRLPRRDEKIP